MIKVRVKDNDVEIIEVINDSDIIIKGEKLKILLNKYKIVLANSGKNEKYNGRVFYIDIIFDVSGNPVIAVETDRGNCYRIPLEMFFYIYNISIEVDEVDRIKTEEPVSEDKCHDEEDEENNDYDYDDDDECYDYDDDDDDDED